MFDKRCDYALNRLDKESIVCQSVIDTPIRLTREDFSSDEEFEYWKTWSDDDYHKIQLAGRDDDNCLAFSDTLDDVAQSAEDALLCNMAEAEKSVKQAAISQRIKKLLTKVQYRRLWMRYVENLKVEDIAAVEGVSKQAIYKCLDKAVRVIVNNL